MLFVLTSGIQWVCTMHRCSKLHSLLGCKMSVAGGGSLTTYVRTCVAACGCSDTCNVSGVTLSPRLCSLCCLALQPTGALLAGGDPSHRAGGYGRQAANDCVL